MPGLDKNRLVDDSQMGNAIICGICFGIFTEPMVTPCCGQTYCGECNRDWLRQNNKCHSCRKGLTIDELRQPPIFMITVLNRLWFICQFAANGCEEKQAYEALSQHTETCKFNPNANCMDCGEKNGKKSTHQCIENLKRSKISLEICTKELIEFNENNRKQSNALEERLNANIKALSDDLLQSREDIRKHKLTIDDLRKEIISLKKGTVVMEQKINSFNKCIAEEFDKQFGYLKRETSQTDGNISKATEYLACEIDSCLETLCFDSDDEN